MADKNKEGFRNNTTVKITTRVQIIKSKIRTFLAEYSPTFREH